MAVVVYAIGLGRVQGDRVALGRLRVVCGDPHVDPYRTARLSIVDAVHVGAGGFGHRVGYYLDLVTVMVVATGVPLRPKHG